MKTKLSHPFATAFAALLILLTAASLRAGTITVVDLPATGTDAASDISTNKHYVCAFDYGNSATPPSNINGVPITQFGWPGASNNHFATTNAVDANFGGQVVFTTGGPNNNQLANTSNLGQGSGASQADGNMQALYADIIYPGGVGNPGAWIQQEFDNLTPGQLYSLRIYYRYWGNTPGSRQIEVYFNGEGTQEAYSNNPIAEDAGGAHYIKYDFTAATTNVFCLITNDIQGDAALLWGATLEDDSYPSAPVITHQPSSVRANAGSSNHFMVTATGYPVPAYQWYFNTSSNYTGATIVTNTVDGRITGSATNTLTITNAGSADGGYYFAIITNNSGAVTSSIVNFQVDYVPAVTQQPSSAEVKGGNSTNFNVTVGIGVPPLAYQWYFNTSSNYTGAMIVTNTVGGRISGAASNTLTITNAGAADIGYYYCVITNNYGATTSAIVNLQVDLLPVITSQTPTGSFSMFANQTETLSVTVGGGLQGRAYRWFTNGVADGTGNSATYYASAASSASGETFQCIVTNNFGAATSAVVTLTTINPLPAGVTSSPYSTSVLALNPAFYWPMHETAAPAPGDIETNYGSLGALGTAYYADWAVNNGAPGSNSVLHQIPGALANGSDEGVNLLDPGITASGGVTTNSYLLVPHTSPLTTLTPPFTIELWMMATNTGFGDLVSQDGTTLNVGNANNTYGGRVTWGAGSGYSSANTIFQVYNGITTGSGYNTNKWHYVVVTCDGSTYTIYVDNAQAGSAAVTFKPDSWDPLTIGAGLWNGGGVTRQTAMSLDEVAIYTNVLTADEISNHWAIATNSSSGPSDYYNAVISDNPLLYYRMNSPSYTGWPATNTWPVLNNYGITAGNGVYMPGVAPGSVAGPGFYGLFDTTNAMPGNGVSAFADAGYNPALNPTGHTPFSITACFKGNPADSRFQNIVGHSDNSWRIAVDPTGKLHFNAGAGGEITSAGVYNDGNWHQVVGAYDGTSNYLYVDGVLDSQTLAGTNGITGSANDVLLGADPQYLTVNTGAGRQFAGDLCEVAFFNNALTAAQVKTLFDAIGAPVTTVSTPVLSRVGSATMFSVTANGSSPAYQWYFNTVSNYDGATTLTDGGGVSGSGTARVTITDVNAYYFAVATNNWGAATSSIVQVPQVLTALSAGKPIWNQAGQSNIIVMFSDVVDPITATTAGNYSLDNGATVHSATLAASNEVVLTTSVLNPATSYTLTVQNVENYFGVTQTPSSTDLAVGVYPANLALWVSADTGLTTNSDGTVTQWNDLSGNGNNLLGATPYSFNDPLLTNSATGQPVVYFNATNGTYGTALYANDAPSLEITGDMSVVAVVNFPVPAFGGGIGEIVSKTGYNNPNVPAPYDYHAADNGLSLLRGDGNTGATDYGTSSGSATISSGQPHIFGFSETGNAVTHYLDGQAVGTSGFNRSFVIANAADQGQPVFVGGREDNTKYNAEKLSGNLYELIVAGSAISGYDVAQLDKYFTARHHLVNTTPTNIVTAVTGSQGTGYQLTLSWPADHTGWTLQAQTNSLAVGINTNWVDVSGSGATNQVTVPLASTNGCVFYRLIYRQ
jgi:Concanavalin A-like lectin/glucanases superfamily/Immunoglobulin domain/Immunoglobulin I-set domain